MTTKLECKNIYQDLKKMKNIGRIEYPILEETNMLRYALVFIFAGFLMALDDMLPNAYARNDTERQQAVSGKSNRVLLSSSGKYQGHRWRIDDNHLLWWDGNPYVRFGFTGNGNPEKMVRAGFDQFTLMPAEKWPISGPDPGIVKSVDETSDQLEKVGATYYGILNTFWPWRYGNLISESDKVAVFIRDVQNVTKYAGSSSATDFTIYLPIHPAEQDKVKPHHSHAVLFDLEHWKRYDLSDKVEEVNPIIAESNLETSQETDKESLNGKAFRVRLKPIRFPESSSLRLIFAMEVRLAEMPGVNGLPPLWKPGIRKFYRRSLEAFRSAYAKPGLRGLQFGDEINTFPLSLLTVRTYLDIRHDAVALKAYRNWLAERFENIKEMNHQFGTTYVSFDRVQWQVPLHPYAPELARNDAAAEREESWKGAKTAWGLAGTVEQLRAVSRVQDEFRIWFCGHWLAEYAKMAKEIIGPVPVYVCSAAIGGDANQYLAMHRWALIEGVDGLIRNHYGHGAEEERYTLANLAQWMMNVQEESGCTKHLWANEVGYVGPHITDAEWAAAEASDLGPNSSFGSQWAFPSHESLQQVLTLMTQYGYRGFNRFLMNPSAHRATQEVEWMGKLRSEIVPLVVKTKGPPPAPVRLTFEQVITAARTNSRVESLLRGVPAPRFRAEFSEQWGVWLVHFFAGDRPLGFASVNRQGEVLEVGRADEHD